ncbi:uncharacterized protein LOC111055859 [Nilaparvata lugens]|uniref:uncharacterized protein LOC111055859 n=1 Tax=Nilaparvata lugens TaxID=108931 RepID=UPI00193D03FC|nr:uncharacterized protein LOC111055859 [Nilaparvata lugens]
MDFSMKSMKRLFKKAFCKWSLRKVTLIIGWFNFITSFIPFLALIIYAINGAKGIDEFLYGAMKNYDENLYDKNPERLKFLKTIAGFISTHKLLKFLKDYEQDYSRSVYLVGLDRVLAYDNNQFGNSYPFINEWYKSKSSTPDKMDDYVGSYQWSSWNTEPTVILEDFVGSEVTEIVHRILFAVAGDSTFFLILVGSILGIGVTSNAWLLFGAHTDSGPMIAVWLAGQIFILVFDVSLLVCIAIYSSDFPLLVIQFTRICFGLYSIIVVHRYYHKLYYDQKQQAIDNAAIESQDPNFFRSNIENFRPTLTSSDMEKCSTLSY